MKVYLVQGTTGEYDDRIEWVVCAYKSKAKAKHHAEKADKRAKQIMSSLKSCLNFVKGSNEFDPEMCLDYTGTSYTFYPVEYHE